MLEHRSNSLDRRYRRALQWGLAFSLVAHAAIFLVFDEAPLPPSPFSAAGERTGDARAARGGGMEAVELMSPPDVPESPPVPVPEPTPEEVEELEEVEEQVEDVGVTAPLLGEVATLPGPIGLEDGPGLEDGTGTGDGGTEEEGRFRAVPPRPRGMIMPPGDRPDRVRGKEVDVWVFVSAEGRVVPDSTRLNPSTGDRRYDRRLREHAADWVFEAAMRDGSPIAEWFRYTIVM